MFARSLWRGAAGAASAFAAGLYLLPTADSVNLPTVPLASVAAALAAEDGNGVCEAWLPVSGTAALLAAHGSACVLDAQARPRPSPKFRESSGGRWHCVEGRIDAASLRTFEQVEALLLPCVRACFAGEFYRSELQVLNAAPGAEAQFFHQDNRRRGLTVMVPLVTATPDMGPTQVLTCTHALTGATEALPPAAWLPALCAAVAGVAAAQPRDFDLGTALFLDARCLHRGLANSSAEARCDTHTRRHARGPQLRVDTRRPVLVFRYDARESPPPGHSVVSTAAFRLLGRALHAAWHAKRAVGLA